MQGCSALKCFCITFLLVVIVAEMVSGAPPNYSSYEDNVRGLFELLQKNAMADRLDAHQVSRKSSRSPSLRLRFGRRSDDSLIPVSQYLWAEESKHEDD